MRELGILSVYRVSRSTMLFEDIISICCVLGVVLWRVLTLCWMCVWKVVKSLGMWLLS